jgi:hypothetical protein
MRAWMLRTGLATVGLLVLLLLVSVQIRSLLPRSADEDACALPHSLPPRPWREVVTAMRFQACGEPDGHTYVVAVNGLDENPCTVVCPCWRITHTRERMDGESTLYIRGGTYSKYTQTYVFLPQMP